MTKGLASGPRDAVSAWAIWASLVAGVDAVSFTVSQTHFGDGYALAFVIPWQAWVSWFAVFSVASGVAGVRLLTRRGIDTRVLVLGLSGWSASSFVFGVALVQSAGWAGLTGGTKWFSCSAGAIIASAVAIHSDRDRLGGRIEQVVGWIAEDFTIEER